MILKKASVIIGLGLFLFVIFLPGYTKIQELRDKNRDLTDKNRRLKAENAQLEQMLKRLESDKLYQEKILREKAGVVRKDEVPVKFIPQD
jgi:cell division protein FtsB